MKKQVEKSHYAFHKYMDKKRWVSVWHQLDEVVKLNPSRVLEIGPGAGFFKAVGTISGLDIETLDIDPDLNPDHVASVFKMPFEDDSFDVTCAFQMLEHLPYEDSQRAFAEMIRVARCNLVISLPISENGWPISITLPKLGQLKFNLAHPRPWLIKHKFDGEHYWEINKKGYSLNKVVSDLTAQGQINLVSTFYVHENPYHQFFVFEKHSGIS
jgi:predicted SAM-dependent methyltransferase